MQSPWGRWGKCPRQQCKGVVTQGNGALTPPPPLHNGAQVLLMGGGTTLLNGQVKAWAAFLSL